MGADRASIKFLVDDYLDRILFTRDFNKEFRRTQTEVDELITQTQGLKKNSSKKPILTSSPSTIKPTPNGTSTLKPNTSSRKIATKDMKENPVFPIVEPWKIMQTSLDERL